MKNLVRLSSLLLFALITGVNTGSAQEKKQPVAVGTTVEVQTAPAELDPASWKEYKPESGHFTILFPGTPQEETQKLNVGQSEIIIRTLKLHELAIYSVMYSDYPVAVANPEAARGILDFTAKEGVEMYKAEPLDRQEITLEGHPGRFLKQRLPDGLVMRLKFYLVGQKLYQLMITTPQEEGATDEQRRFYDATAGKFLDSFKLAPATTVTPGGAGAGSGPALKNLPRAPISGGILNGKAISKPTPAYPAAARQAGVSGTVEVAIVIDEDGRVIKAEAISGPDELREAAVEAARLARFSLTRLSGQPVKVSGRLVYNFGLR